MYDDEVLGEEYGEEVEGDLMGAAPGRIVMRRRPMLRLPPKPAWRSGRVAPGIWGPREGLEPLPLSPSQANGQFSAGVLSIGFSARPQRPFRAERLLAQVGRSGPTAAGVLILMDAILVGTRLQQVAVGQGMSVEFFERNAFGVRLNLEPAEPGIEITIPCNATPGLVAPDFIQVNLIFLGRTLS